MKEFPQLEKVIVREATVQQCYLRRAHWEPGTYTFQSDTGNILVRWHYGLYRQVCQRVPSFGKPEEFTFHRAWGSRTASALQVAMLKPGTAVRLLPIKEGVFELYGLVNPRRFQASNKCRARATFHQVLQEFGIATDQSEHSETHYGAPIESFALPPGRHTRALISLQYGLDTGVNAYKLRLGGIKVIVCSNGLVADGIVWRWDHLQSSTPIEVFLRKAIPTLLEEHTQLELKIEVARCTGNELDPMAIVKEKLPWLPDRSGSKQAGTMI